MPAPPLYLGGYFHRRRGEVEPPFAGGIKRELANEVVAIGGNAKKFFPEQLRRCRGAGLGRIGHFEYQCGRGIEWG